MKKWTTAIILGGVVVGGYFAFPRSTPIGDFRVVLNAHVDGEKLVFNEFVYENPNGPGQFMVQDFRFFVSNITLNDGETGFAEPDSYHLARFDNAENTFEIIIKDVPLVGVSQIGFSIGLDPAANSSTESRGDLDPNSRMAWNWEVGYKFVLFEGSLRVENETFPLVYHIGFDENQRHLSFDSAVNTGPEIRLNVNIMALFNGVNPIDLHHLQSVKFDRIDARSLTDNYGSMIAPQINRGGAPNIFDNQG